MKIITLNLNGIRSASRKGFYDWFPRQKADFVCLQELKAHEVNLDDQMKSPKGYFGNFSYANKKGYSGVGIYSKEKPNKIVNKIGIPEIDDEGRYIEIDLDKIVIISVYLPSGSSGEERQKFKYKVLDQILLILKKKLKLGKNIVVCGDFNIAHHEIDLKNFKGNKKNSGFLPEERAWIDKIINHYNCVDAFRFINDKPDNYTWWSNRGRAWDNNVGWRIDYQMLSSHKNIAILSADIYKKERFSDHSPLIIDYDI